MVAQTMRSSAAAADKRRRERRRCNRLPADVAAILTPPGEPAKVNHVLVSNLGIHGVGFKSARHLSAGEKFQFDMGAGPLRLCGLVRIVSCRSRRDGSYDVGAEFL
jgi:hypothetical protein